MTSLSTTCLRTLAVLGTCFLAAPLLAHDDDPKILDRQAPYVGPGYRPGSIASKAIPMGSMASGYSPASFGAVGQPVMLNSLEDDHIQFPADGVQLLSWIPLQDLDAGAATGNDCWGYVSGSGREYAMIGLSNGTSFVEISSPSDPDVIAHIPGEPSLWRDIKVFQNYAYIVSEGGGGIQVVNLGQIDNGIVTLQNTIQTGGILDTHNVAIDEVSGYLYRCGGTSGQGLRVYNLNNNPASPQYVGSWNQRYVHDVQVVTYDSGPYNGRQIAFACGGFGNGSGATGLTIVDVTNKSNMFVRAQHFYDNGKYSHQAWLSPDRSTLFLNDEKDEDGVVPTTTIVVDVTNLNSPVNLGTFTNGNSAIGHNIYTLGDQVFEANYRSGLRIFDVPNPPAATEVAYFDTWPGDDNENFNGLWSCYPYFPSGLVIGSDLERGLFVWYVGEPKLTFDVTVPELIDPAGEDVIVQISEESVGDLQAGTATLYFDAGAGLVEVPLQSQGGGSHLAQFPALPCDSEVNWFVGARSTDGLLWTMPKEAPYNNFDSIAVEGQNVLYEDDMEIDRGWTAGLPGDTATSGFWALGDPVANAAGTEDDHTPGAGVLCWLTGTGGDVDNGFVTLESPPYDLNSASDPILEFWLWFRRDGNVQGVDQCRILLSDNDGASYTLVEKIQAVPPYQDGSWVHKTYRLSDWIDPSSTVRLRVVAKEENLDTALECMVDDLRITERLCGCSSTNYCSSTLNSNGTSAQISSSGTAEIAQNNFTLSVSGAVPNNLGLFFYGPDQTTLPLAEGTLCVSGGAVGIQRLQPPIQLDGTGSASRFVDYNLPPASGGPGALTAGSTWNFQFWYRDPAGGPGGSNLSDSLEVTFCP